MLKCVKMKKKKGVVLGSVKLFRSQSDRVIGSDKRLLGSDTAPVNPFPGGGNPSSSSSSSHSDGALLDQHEGAQSLGTLEKVNKTGFCRFHSTRTCI